MIDEQIFELAIQHLRYFEDGWRANEWSGTPDELLKFARVMYNKGQEEEIQRQKTGIGYVNGVLIVDEF